MNTSNWFDDMPVIGKMAPEQAAEKLRELDEYDTAEMLESAQETPSKTFRGLGKKPDWWPFQDKPWQYTAHAFGYLAPDTDNSGPLPIRAVSNIPPDPSLKHARIKITLNRLRVASYPGSGMHRHL